MQIVPVPLAELKLVKAPKIPQVEKVLSESHGKFPPAEKAEVLKDLKKKPLSEIEPKKASPPHLGNKIDIIAK